MKFFDQQLVERVLDGLKEWGPFIYAENEHSIYIHFEHLPNELTHKLRISDHPERAKYGYKWQLRLDGDVPERERKQYCRYYSDPAGLIKAFANYYFKVQHKDEDIPNGNNNWP